MRRRFARGPLARPVSRRIHLGRTEDFERWVDDQRRVLDALYRKSRTALAQACQTRGDYALAAEHWRALSIHDPLDAAVARHLVRALANAGNRAAALKHAREHEAVARRELGVAADPASSSSREK